MEGEQLAFDFTISATQRRKRATKLAEAEEQPTLFASWSPDIDVHLHSPDEAIAQITGPDPDRAHYWLADVVGTIRPIKTRRVAFGTDKLDRLISVRPPAQVTLDAAAGAVARALWAHALGLKPLRVRRAGQRLLADSPRWPAGLRVKDAPWTAIATLSHLGVPLDISPDATSLFAKRLADAGASVATASLAGSAVLLRTNRPELVERMGLPGLAYAGRPNDGMYKLPLLSSAPLLNQPLVRVPPELARTIREATAPARPVTAKQLGPDFPWTLYPFQAEDAGKALRILKTTGGVLLAGDMGSGKALWVGQAVLTPHGPVRAGDVRVGDELVGRDGHPTRVVGVYPQGERDLFQVTFTDGTAAVVDDEHLWAVHPADGAELQVLTTRDLRTGGVLDPGGKPRWQVPLCDPIEFIGTPVPDDLAYQAGGALAAGGVLGDGLRYAATAARVAALHGALDACGRVSGGSVRAEVPTAAAAGEVAWLARSLGGTALVRAGTGRWTVDVHLPSSVAPFRDPARSGAYATGAGTPVRAVTAVEAAGRGPAVCFKVDADDELFLLGDAVVTHNTTVSLALVQILDTWPLLVVAPLSAFSTWARQLGEMGRSFSLATGSAKTVWETIEAGEHDAVVVAYDRLHAFVEVIERAHFKAMVADEIQRIRTPNSKRSRALRALAASMPIRIGLSGTPVTNTLSDILAVGAALAPGEWRPRANSKDLEDMYPGSDPVEAVAEHLGSMMVRRRIDQVGRPMPDRNDHRIYVAMTPEQRAAIAALEAEAQAAKEAGAFDGPNGKFNALVKLSKMRKIIANPRSAGVAGPNPKVDHAVRLIRDFHSAGRKGVVFCVDRATFTDLGAELDKAGIRWGGIWGSTPPLERVEVEKRLHRGELDVVICTIAAGGESWTASPTATYCLFLSYVWAPSALAQAEARVYRLNADLDGPPIEIMYLHATGVGGARLGGPDGGEDAPVGSIDDRMVEVLEAKKQLFAQVVDRTAHVDTTQVHATLSDLLFVLTGERDEKLAAREADEAATMAREQACKKHARETLYARKGRNRTDASLGRDDGSTTITLEDYRRDRDPDVQALLEDLDLAEGEDVDLDEVGFTPDEDDVT